MVVIDNKRMGKLRLRGGVALSRGLNEVDGAAWEVAKECPITQHFLKLGVIMVASPSVAATASEPSHVGKKTMPVRPATPRAKPPKTASDNFPLSEVTPAPPPERRIVEPPTAPEPASVPVTLEAPEPAEGPKDPAQPKAFHLDALSTKEAIIVIGEVNDREVLEKAIELEPRTRVVKAIRLRLASLKE